MTLVEQLTVKLLAQASRDLGGLTAECLCSQPDHRVVRRLLNEVRARLNEFDAAYFTEDSVKTRE